MFKRLVSLSVVLVALISASVAQAMLVASYNMTTYDNGMNGIWTVLTGKRVFTIQPLGGDGYQVSFDDSGTLETIAAKSPGGDGTTTVAAGVRGKFSGHAVVIIHGVLKGPLPANLGGFDFRGGTGAARYFLPLFSSIISVEYTDWGWKYTTCGNGTWIDNDATETLYGSVGPNAQMGDIVGSPAKCQDEPPAPVWFDPGDGRIDPRPGDRLAVWCNTTAVPPNVVVYGVAGSDQPDWNKGFYLATFVNADLLKAGRNGITKNAVEGTVSMMQDGNGHFYVAWNGGKYGATGQGIWSKTFSCEFPKS